MLIKSTDTLIHFDYTRYFHYYRIRKVLEAYFLFSSLMWTPREEKAKRTFSLNHIFRVRKYQNTYSTPACEVLYL